MPANTNTDLRNGVNGDVGCKYPCDCATTAPIELEGTQTIDGFSAVENKIVLVKNQVDKTENGPYVVSTGSWERGVWFNNSLNATAGSLITVAYGSTNAKTIWETVCADANIDFGTSEIDFELKVKGSNTGDKSIELTGPITGTSTESTPGVLTVATAITNASVTNANLANMATGTFKMRVDGTTGAPQDGTATQVTAALNVMVGDSGSGGTKGLVPAPAIGDASKFLKGDGTYGTQNVPDASESVKGISQIATQVEVDAGTNDTKFVTPLKLATKPIRTGSQVQQVNTQTGAVDTTTVQMPYDDTIPQNTEGKEFMSLVITPTSATNKIRVQVVFNFANSSGASAICLGLFQDSTANALAAVGSEDSAAGIPSQMVLDYTMDAAGTTSATTFKVRAGPSGAQTLTFNGSAGARKFGGVMCSSIVITEIKV